MITSRKRLTVALFFAATASLGVLSACSASPTAVSEAATRKTSIANATSGPSGKVTLSNIRGNTSQCDAKFTFSGLAPNVLYVVGYKKSIPGGSESQSATFASTGRGTGSVSTYFTATRLSDTNLYTQVAFNNSGSPTPGAPELTWSDFALTDRCAAYVP